MELSPTAYNLIRNGPHYRREAFDEGLRNAGFKVRHALGGKPRPDDILLIWNRYGGYEHQANNFEAAGATVLVAENGYFSKDDEKHVAISVSQHHHGGAMFHKCDVGLVTPGRTHNGHILICAQRGIGSKTMKSPAEWHKATAQQLKKLTNREIRIRMHPGKDKAKVDLLDDLNNCHACIVWSSACGVQALLEGVPTYYAAPRWIAEESALPLSKILSKEVDINDTIPYGINGITKMLANQYTIPELAAGEPFKKLLGGNA